MVSFSLCWSHYYICNNTEHERPGKLTYLTFTRLKKKKCNMRFLGYLKWQSPTTPPWYFFSQADSALTEHLCFCILKWAKYVPILQQLTITSYHCMWWFASTLQWMCLTLTFQWRHFSPTLKRRCLTLTPRWLHYATALRWRCFTLILKRRCFTLPTLEWKFHTTDTEVKVFYITDIWVKALHITDTRMRVLHTNAPVKVFQTP